MTTGFVYDPRFCDHDTGPGHPERPARLRAIHDHLQTTGRLDRMTSIAFGPADMDWVRTVHQQAYIDRLRVACDNGSSYIDDPNSTICAQSYELALLAVGGALAAADAVMAGQVDNAFCALRPPGHHAEHGKSMGFCLFNNVAITAAYLRQQHGLDRIAIVDFDVHHGNGTQHTFEHRHDVLFISIHEDPAYLYPGMGFAHETGKGEGERFTINIPMAPHSTDDDYHRAFEKNVIPALLQFGSQALLISAGFDAATADPLAHIKLTTECFGWMVHRLRDVAQQTCDGRIICLLEGGYDLNALAHGVEAVIRILLDGM